jgi:uncharacterized membrane protein YhaH (DUF805 family)
MSALHSLPVARHWYVTGFWLCVAAAALALMTIGAGLNLIAGRVHPANAVIVAILVVLAVVFGLFVRVAVRLRRRALDRQLSRPRLMAATLTLGAALVGGVILFGHQNAYDHSCPAGAPSYACVTYVRPGWVYTAALGSGLAGLAAAAVAVAGQADEAVRR